MSIFKTFLCCAVLAGGPACSESLEDLRTTAMERLRSEEYAHAYRMGRWLLANDPVARQDDSRYLSYLQRAANGAPWTFDGNFAILPSTNVTGASSETLFVTDIGTFVIDNSEDKRQSGVGATVGLRLGWRHSRSPGQEFRLIADTSATWFEADEARSRRMSGIIEHEWLSAGQLLTLRYRVDRLTYPEVSGRTGPAYTQHGPQVDYRFDPSGPWAYSGRLSYGWRVMDEKPHQDGALSKINGSATYAIDGRSNLSLYGAVARGDFQRQNLSYNEVEAGVSYSRQTANGLDWSAGVTLGHSWYDANFTALSYPREDSAAAVNVAVSHRDLEFLGRKPRLSCSFRNNESNVALYQSDSVSCALSFDYRF